VGVRKVGGKFVATYLNHDCGTWPAEKLAASAYDRAALHAGCEPENLPTLAVRLGAASPAELRAEAQQKQQSLRKRNSKGASYRSSEYVGVSGRAFPGGVVRWAGVVRVDGTQHTVGGWSTPKKAAIARDRVLLYFDPDARLQVPAQSRRLGPASPLELRAQADNKARPGSSIYRGVHLCSVTGLYACQFSETYVGRFDTEAEAARAFDKVARKAGFNESRLNFPRRR